MRGVSIVALATLRVARLSAVTMEAHHATEDDQFPDNQEFVPYVCGVTAAQLSGRRVRVWARVVAGGSAFELPVRTVDDEELTVRPSGSVPSRPTPGAWIEFVGTLQGRTLLCEEMLEFPETASADLDKNSHRAFTHLLVTLDDPWNLGETENSHTN